MSEIEIITDGGRRRRWPATEMLRIVEETLEEGARISVVARRNGVAPNLLYRWRRLPRTVRAPHEYQTFSRLYGDFTQSPELSTGEPRRVCRRLQLLS
ncbi:transposase IS3/IS911 family protein, partial [Roseivivax marinus]